MNLESWFTLGIMVKTWAHGLDWDSCYRFGFMVWTWTNGTDMDSWYRHELMVQTFTCGMVCIGTFESYTYKRA